MRVSLLVEVERVDEGVESMYIRLESRRPVLELRPNEVAKRKRHSMLGSSPSDRECESYGPVIVPPVNS